jgi:hypothetical protein
VRLKLGYRDNWNGGNYFVGDEDNVVSLEDVKRFFIVKDEISSEVHVVFSKTHGVDNDHGHQYAWERVDAYVQYLILGIVQNIPLMDYIKKGFVEVEV